MRTFLALRHMGSVLCVTDQVPWSHSRDGATNVGEEGAYLRGERRTMSAFVLGAAIAVVWEGSVSGLMASGASSFLRGMVVSAILCRELSLQVNRALGRGGIARRGSGG